MKRLSPKKIPERKCIVCGNRYPKRRLLRVVLNEEGRPEADRTGKKPGRGVYICADEKCEKTPQRILRGLRGLHRQVDMKDVENIVHAFTKWQKEVSGIEDTCI